MPLLLPPTGRCLPWLLACSLGLAGCASQSQSQPQPQPQSQSQPAPGPAAAATPAAALQALQQQIQQEVGDAPCDASAQCRSLAFGAKACGGPERWIAWSTRQGDAQRLAAWSAESARLARQRDAQSGTQSTCSLVADPGAVCSAGRCVLQPRGRSLAN